MKFFYKNELGLIVMGKEMVRLGEPVYTSSERTVIYIYISHIYIIWKVQKHPKSNFLKVLNTEINKQKDKTTKSKQTYLIYS